MDASLLTLIAAVCLFGIVASDDILSNVFTGLDNNNQGGVADGRVNNGAGGLMVNLNPNAAGVNLGGLGGAYGSGYGGGYLDNYGYDDLHDDHSNDRHMSSVADLVNVVFGLGGHVVGRAGWIVRDALGALTNVGSLLTHSLDMGLAALRLGGRLLSNSKIVKELKKPLGVGRGTLFNGNLLNKLLNKRDGMLYSNHRLGDDDFGLMNRALGGLRGYGGLYGPSYPSYYQRFAGRDDD